MTWLYYVIPGVLAVAALAVIVTMYLKAFPKASALDLEAMTLHRQQKRKANLVENRLRRKLSTFWLSLQAFSKPIAKVVLKLGRSVFQRLVQLEKKYRLAAKGTVSTATEPAAAANSVVTAVQEGNSLLEDGKLAEAEKKFIAAVGLDSRSLDAYRGLAKVYIEMGDKPHAIATLQFMIQLDPKDQGIYRQLGELQIEAEKYEDALESFEQVLELNPNSPKNLDALIEVAILNKLKYKAQSTLDKLKEVNPDNQKLEKYQSEINQL